LNSPLPLRWAESVPASYQPDRRFGLRDRYLHLLWVILAGYATFGKGFASLGVPPLFIGEVALVLGLCIVFQFRSWVALFATGPSVLQLVLIAWIIVRTIPGVQAYGVLAIRDSVIVVYGVFSLIVIALMIERPERLAWTVHAYGYFALIFGLIAAPLFFLAGMFGAHFPAWPLSGVPLIYVRPGEIGVHLAGSAVFMLLGLRKATVPWVVMIILGIGVITPSRGATLACIIPIGIAIILSGKIQRFVPLILAGSVAFAVGYAADIDIVLPGGRSMGPRQITHNLTSLIGSSEEANLDNTKTWRLGWWQAIEGYTFHGPYFWTGKGFGQSLAEVDGFVVGEETGGPPLRSPHNAHLNLLARTGVPGLVLWLTTCAAWFGMLMRNMAIARRRGDAWWNALFIWIGCYGLSILIDASFDVALEGPMLGIWFWSLFGLGIASTMIYSATLRANKRAAIVAAPARKFREAASAEALRRT
jgi:hypothetical protein